MDQRVFGFNPSMSRVFFRIDNLRKIVIKYDWKEYFEIDILIEVVDFEF